VQLYDLGCKICLTKTEGVVTVDVAIRTSVPLCMKVVVVATVPSVPVGVTVEHVYVVVVAAEPKGMALVPVSATGIETEMGRWVEGTTFAPHAKIQGQI